MVSPDWKPFDFMIRSVQFFDWGSYTKAAYTEWHLRASLIADRIGEKLPRRQQATSLFNHIVGAADEPAAG